MGESDWTKEERERYRRQLPVDGWGESAQARIRGATVGIVGAGGLGSPVATYLAAAGIGTMILCDDQTVELSNMNRQVMYADQDIDRSKVTAAASFLGARNPHVRVRPVNERITEANSGTHLGECDLLVDCLDNWPTRFVLNRLSVERSIPLLHGGIREHWGQFGLLHPPHTACLACFLNPPDDPPDAEGPIPVYGAVAGSIGSMMAAAALRAIGGLAPDGAGRLRLFDALAMTLESVSLERRGDCPVCGTNGD